MSDYDLKNNTIGTHDGECIHMSDNAKCCILRVENCPGAECPFRETSESNKNAEENWRKRLNAMTADSQERIAREYYGGKMPWKTGKGMNNDV